MPKLIYDFEGGRRRSRSTSTIELAVEIAIYRLGSITEVCSELGVNRNALARWRAGDKPHAANRRALAKLADIPAKWLDSKPDRE